MSRQKRYRKLLVAPANLRERTLELIERETAHAQAGRGGRIIAKMNALVDPERHRRAVPRVAERGGDRPDHPRHLLPAARRARGQRAHPRHLDHRSLPRALARCSTSPTVAHPEYYFGSADWMPRNLDRRVEAMVPIEDVQLHRQLQSVLETCLADNRQAWEMGADGEVSAATPGGRAGARDAADR